MFRTWEREFPSGPGANVSPSVGRIHGRNALSLLNQTKLLSLQTRGGPYMSLTTGGSGVVAIGPGRNAEQFENLSLQLGQLRLEVADVRCVVLENVALGEAEHAEDLLGGGTMGAALLGYSASDSTPSRYMLWRSSRSMRAWTISARKYTKNSASMRPSFFSSTGAISNTGLVCSKRCSMLGCRLWAWNTWASVRERSLVSSGNMPSVLRS